MPPRQPIDDVLPPRAPHPVPLTIKRTPEPKFREPFGHSRSFLAVMLLGFILLASFGFASWYYGQINYLSKAADTGAERRANKVEALAKGVISNVSAKNMVVEIRPSDGRIVAPATAQIDELVVGVFGAVFGPVHLQTQPAQNEFLVVNLRVTNVGSHPLKYEGWMDPSAKATLRDINRNYFNRISFPPNDQPRGRYQAGTIDPSLTINDLVVFEAMPLPMGGGTDLELDFPYGEKTFKFRIPFSFVQRQMNTTSPVIAAPQKISTPEVPPPPPVPYDAARDTRVRQAVIIAYSEGLAEISRHVKRIDRDAGRKYRVEALARMISALATKYDLDEDQVKVIWANRFLPGA